MKKITMILIAIMVICVGFLSGCNEQKDSNIPTQTSKIGFTIKFNAQTEDDTLDVEMRVYDNIANWRNVDPILNWVNSEKEISLCFSNFFDDLSRGFTLSSGKTYLIELWYVDFCTGCDWSVPENMYNKHFYGIFSDDEIFTIHSTGYITNQIGDILSEIPP